jgi:hypothetical protein
VIYGRAKRLILVAPPLGVRGGCEASLTESKPTRRKDQGGMMIGLTLASLLGAYDDHRFRIWPRISGSRHRWSVCVV